MADQMKRLHVRHVNPAMRLDNGKKVAGLQTEHACRQAIATYGRQIAKIQQQIQSGGPYAVRRDPDAFQEWKLRAEGAIEHKAEIVAQIRVSLELAREARRRQLVDLRIRREADRKKLARLQIANQHPDVHVRYFRDEARRRLGETEYEDIWRAANEAREADGIQCREKLPLASTNGWVARWANSSCR